MNETLTIIGLLILNGILIKALIVRKTTLEKKKVQLTGKTIKVLLVKALLS